MSSELPPPTSLGRYRIVRRLGAGGMAEVFLAKMTGAEGLEKLLVVKRVLPAFGRSPKFLAMFVDEAKLAMRLNHPNIVQVYAFEQVKSELRAAEGAPKEEFLLAMEYVDGMDLGRLLHAARRANRRLSPNLCALIALEVAKGLDYAHNRKDEAGAPMEIVHRDVSPQNVLVSYDGAVKIADFGIARARMITEETGIIKGKFGYMSPEQAKGQRVDRRSDVYALGVMLAELLMGRAMYVGLQGMEVLEEVRLGRVTSPRSVDPSVPPELDAIVMRSLATDREERYQTCRSLAGALSRYLHAQDEPPDLEMVERFLGDVAPRELTSPEVSGQKEVPIAAQATVLSVPSASIAQREVRERRHVLAVTGFFRDAQGTSPGFATRDHSAEQALQMIEEIAFKYGAILDRPPVSPGTPSFNLLLGLGRSTVDDPLHACRMALDILEALVGLSADAIRALTASIGISRGTVTSIRAPDRRPRWEPEGSVLEVAHELARSAEAGGVLTSGEVYRLARRAFAFEDPPREVTIQGPAAPRSLRGWRLSRAHDARHLKRGDDRAATGLLGRAAERDAIAGIWGEIVATGKGAWIAVVGELGVGKTALLTRALAELEPSPQVVRAECAFGSNDVPFAALAELVGEALGGSLGNVGGGGQAWRSEDVAPGQGPAELTRASLDRALGGLGLTDGRRRTLVEAFEPLFSAQDAESRDGGDRTERLYSAARTLLALLARRRPLVVWVDSAQFMDPPSRELLARMTQGELEVPIAVIFSTRPDARVESALAGALRIDVGELDEEDRKKLVASHLGAQVAPDLLSAITQRAGGNPFFLIELVDALLERGAIRVEGGEAGTERKVVRVPGTALQLPASLEDVIAVRIAELEERDRAVLQWLAVAGPGLQEDELDLLVGHDASAALGVLAERGLVEIRAGGQIAFSSLVVRQVAYEGTDSIDRARMHRRVGAHWQSRPGRAPAARIARHHELAGEAKLAAAAWREAGERARAAYSNREALRFWGRALSLLPASSAERFELHERREHVLRTLSMHGEQRAELEAMRALAEQHHDHRMIAIALSRLARHDLDAGRLAGVDALLHRALDAAIGGSDRAAEIECLRLLGHLRRDQGDLSGALVAFERGLGRAGVLEEHLPARGMILVNLSNLLWRWGKLEEAQRAAAEGYAIFRRLDTKGQAAFALNSLGVSLASAGRFEDAIACITASIVLDRAVGDRIHLGRKTSNIGQLYAELGASDRAVEFIEHALTVLSAVADQVGRTDTLSALAELRIEQRQGELDRASEAVDEAERIASQLADRADLARARMVRAALCMARGAWDEAESVAQRAASDARAAGAVGYEILAEARVLEAMAQRGAPELAAAAAKLERRLDEQTSIERGERVLLALCRAYGAAGDPGGRARIGARAAALLSSREADIRSDELRASFREHPVVRALRAASDEARA